MNRNIIKTIAGIIVFISLPLSSDFARADSNWRRDYEIDQKLGLINQPWNISFPSINNLRELAGDKRDFLPPYPQQPEHAYKSLTLPPFRATDKKESVSSNGDNGNGDDPDPGSGVGAPDTRR